MRRGRELAKNARCVLLVLDGSLSREDADLDHAFRAEGALVDELGPERCLVVWNKADLCPLPESAEGYAAAGVRALDVTVDGEMTFVCESTPVVALGVRVIALEVSG